MRTRAYRPEAPICLEGRSLLSGDPVVLLRNHILTITQQTEISFQSFGRDPSIPDLRISLSNVIVMIPFEQVDGLGMKINGIVTTMGQELSDKVPHAIRSAYDEVLAACRAEIAARVQAGDVVVR